MYFWCLATQLILSQVNQSSRGPPRPLAALLALSVGARRPGKSPLAFGASRRLWRATASLVDRRLLIGWIGKMGNLEISCLCVHWVVGVGFGVTTALNLA